VKDIAGGGDAGVTEVGHIVGTPHFMAPEAVAGADHMGAPADVYAVGAVAYGLLTGQRVFGGKSGTEIIGHHLHTPPVLPSERLGRPVDPFLERLVLACLAKRPEERPGDAAALLRRLDEGWTGPAWTQDEARQWWETRAPAMLQSVRAAERSVSRGRNLAVDVASRVRSDRLPELELEDDDETALRPVPGSPPADGSK
jgi:serine/threonine-protein kinase